MTSERTAVGMIITVFIVVSGASGAVTAYENRSTWETAAGPYSTINFTELPVLTWITNQYSALGVRFTDGSDQIIQNFNGFADGRGLNGAFDETTLVFDSPMTTIAMEFPGLVGLKLYANGTLFYSSFSYGNTPHGNFVGFVSTLPFDKAIIYGPGGGLFVDTLHFGPPLPGPGALALVGGAALACHQRRRPR